MDSIYQQYNFYYEIIAKPHTFIFGRRRITLKDEIYKIHIDTIRAHDVKYIYLCIA